MAVAVAAAVAGGGDLFTFNTHAAGDDGVGGVGNGRRVIAYIRLNVPSPTCAPTSHSRSDESEA